MERDGAAIHLGTMGSAETRALDRDESNTASLSPRRQLSALRTIRNIPCSHPIVSSPRLLPMQPADKSNLIRSEAELKLEQVRYLPLTDAGVLGVLIRCLTSLAKTKQSG